MRITEKIKLINNLTDVMKERYDNQDLEIFFGYYQLDIEWYGWGNNKEDYNVDIKQTLAKAPDEILINISSELETGSEYIIKEYPKIWEKSNNSFKIFISHLTSNKKIAEALKEALKPYYIECFVAHEDITPTLEWQDEIFKALNTMDAFISLHCDNFKQSVWCQQEIGIAVAKQVKIIPIKFDGKEVKVIDDENEPSDEIIEKGKRKRKPRKKKIINDEGKVEDVEEIVESDVKSEYDEETGKKIPKKRKYMTRKGDIIELEEKEQSEEEPSKEIEEGKKVKTQKKIKKPTIMKTKDGKQVRIIDDENEPSEDIIDEITGKRKPKKKKVVNEKGEIEELKEVIESDITSEYDEETGRKMPKKKKYVNTKGDIYEIEEPSEENSEPSEEYIKKYEKPKRRHHPKTKKPPRNNQEEENEPSERKDLEPIDSEEENEFSESKNLTESKEESEKYDIVEGTTNMGKYFNKNKKKKKERKGSEDETKQVQDKKTKIKPITRIGNKTEIGKLLEKYNFLRTNTFSIKNLKDPDIKFDKKTALLLDLLNDKEQKLKIILWEYFCIWRGNSIDRYQQMAEILKFIKQGSLKNLDPTFLQNFRRLKNPRYYIIAIKKFIDNLFYNQSALKEAFEKWKNKINEENLVLIKSKLLYAIYKNHKEDKIRNIILKYKDKKPIDIIKENNGEYPEDIKVLLDHYFKIWKNILPSDLKEILDGEKIVIAKNQIKQFKKDKYKDQIEEFERRVKEEEEALRRQYELKENDLIIMDQKGNIIDIRNWRNDPLKRVVTIRFRLEKYYKMKYFLKWYSQARVMQVIDRLVPIIEGRAKLLSYLRQKPAVVFFKLLKLRNPEIYLPKLQRLCKLLIKASPFVFNPYKTFLERIILFNRANLLNNILSKVDDITNEYYLKLYLQKWKKNVEDIKEEKRKILLSFIKKKIKDEREISNNRKNELLKRILDRDNKRILNKFRQALKVWAFLAKVPFIVDNGELKTIDGKKVTPENVQEITENNMLTPIFGQDVLDKIGENIISTPEQREQWLKEKLTKFINNLESKNKSLMRTKLYKWHTNINYTQIIEGVKAIQRFLRRKLGHKLQKKRKALVDQFIKKLVCRRIFQIAQLNNLIKTLKKIYADKNILNKLKVLERNQNQNEILKDLIEKTNEKLNKIKLKTYLNRWYKYSEGIYNKECDAITLIQSVYRACVIRRKINQIKRRNELLSKFIKIKDQRNLTEYALKKWDKNTMLLKCDESALKIQKAFRRFNARNKLSKLKKNSNNYKVLCEALSKLSGQPKVIFDKLKNIWGIHSPSTLMANLAGNLVTGFASGLANNAATYLLGSQEFGQGVINEVGSYINYNNNISTKYI